MKFRIDFDHTRQNVEITLPHPGFLAFKVYCWLVGFPMWLYLVRRDLIDPSVSKSKIGAMVHNKSVKYCIAYFEGA